MRDAAPQGRVKASIGPVGRFAQAAGCIVGMAGVGLPVAALVGGGLVASSLTA